MRLVFQEKLGSKSLALKLERRIKRMSKARKEKLIKVGALLGVKIVTGG